MLPNAPITFIMKKPGLDDDSVRVAVADPLELIVTFPGFTNAVGPACKMDGDRLTMPLRLSTLLKVRVEIEDEPT